MRNRSKPAALAGDAPSMLICPESDAPSLTVKPCERPPCRFAAVPLCKGDTGFLREFDHLLRCLIVHCRVFIAVNCEDGNVLQLLVGKFRRSQRSCAW